MPADPPDDDLIHRELQRLGHRLRAAREERNLTQEQVILAVPMNRAHYQKIEAGEANPTLHMLLRISRAIGVRLELVDESMPAADSEPR